MATRKLQNKTVLITGASSGLGREIALRYASEGAKLVVVADLEEKPSIVSGNDQEHTVAKLNRLYGEGRAAFVRTNVTDGSSVQAAVQETVRLGGRLDMAVNVKGVYLGCKHAITQMLKQDPDASGKKGRILNIASILGNRAVEGGSRAAAYCTSKGACMQLSRQLGLEYRHQGINVNALCLGFLRTSLNSRTLQDEATTEFLASRGGWGQVEDVAPAAVFLVSEDANWVVGAGLPVDGGYTAG